ncbi:MAG: carboxypeptidase regulatory-like domain-containing protein [Cyanobacteria bacterium J06641_5]
MRDYFWAIATSFSLVAGTHPQAAAAHGVEVNYQETAAVELQAVYAGGIPMAAAQVTVYAPDAPTEPWLQGKTDARGRFAFVPDRRRPGDWQVRVRQSGHGKFMTIPVVPEGDRATSVGSVLSGSYTPLQKFAMGGLGVWGAVGTALYFSRTPRKER